MSETKDCTNCKYEPDWKDEHQWVRTKCKIKDAGGGEIKLLYYMMGKGKPTVVFRNINNFKTHYPPQLVHDCYLWEPNAVSVIAKTFKEFEESLKESIDKFEWSSWNKDIFPDTGNNQTVHDFGEFIKNLDPLNSPIKKLAKELFPQTCGDVDSFPHKCWNCLNCEIRSLDKDTVDFFCNKGDSSIKDNPQDLFKKRHCSKFSELSMLKKCDRQGRFHQFSLLWYKAPKTKHKLLRKLSVKILMDSGFHIEWIY